MFEKSQIYNILDKHLEDIISMRGVRYGVTRCSCFILKAQTWFAINYQEEHPYDIESIIKEYYYENKSKVDQIIDYYSMIFGYPYIKDR